ncbi:MAG: ferredoxin reductase [Conexibacter sp.]|nr:ferredoxin reductase [Conexibacter sp.]
MKVKVDPTKCEGFGICAELAPQVFELDEWGYAAVLGGRDVPAALEDAVRRAAGACSVAAISTET